VAFSVIITAVSLECGYSASAIRERIYAGDAGYGILLHTGTPDSEGTLGGAGPGGTQDRNASAQCARVGPTLLERPGLCAPSAGFAEYSFYFLVSFTLAKDVSLPPFSLSMSQLQVSAPLL
jgi:hypothetical protein